MKNKLLLAGLSLLLYLYPPLLHAEETEGRFYWALVSTDSNKNITPVTAEHAEKKITIEELILFYQPMENAFLYILLVDPEENLILLFPDDFKIFKKRYETFKRTITVLTSGAQPGDYDLYILVSTKRLVDLEKKLTQYRRMDASERKNGTYKNDLFAIIQKLKRDSRLPSVVQVQFKKEGGVNRNEEEIIEQYIKKIILKGLLCRKYEINKK